MSSETLLISGDFNIHVDVPTGADGIRFRDLLDSVGSLQRVKRPTHFYGHTLDLLITSHLMTSLRKSQRQRYFSDHAVVLCHPRRAKPTSTVRHSEFRKLKAIENKKFWRTSIRTSSLCRDPPDTLEGLVESCNDILSIL